jgi:hypothetical protein
MNIEIAWTREGCRLTHIAANVADLVGWTVAELKTMAIESLVSPASWNFLKENYYVGPAASIAPRSFPLHLRHRDDGHEVCCRVVVVCRYDDDGRLAEAWGTLQHCQNQCCLNSLLDWWPRAEPSELVALNEVVELAAA